MKLITKILIIIIIIFIIVLIYKKINKQLDNNLDGPDLNKYIDINDSSIHGVGLFAKKDFNKNDLLFKAIYPTKQISYHGSLINHSYNPNTYLFENKNGWFIIGLKNIKEGDEITVDYRDTPYFIKKPDPSWK
jgi:hypothetical protein